MIRINSKLIFYVILLLVCIWFFMLNLYTPMMHDDLAYHFYYDTNSAFIRPTSEPITSFWQIFPSMWHHYYSVNGRFTSHFLIQLFCGLLGKPVFNIANTFVLLLFLYYFTKLVPYKNKTLVLSILLASIVYFLPFPGQTMLWLTGSINYFWTATFSLTIIFYIINSKDRRTKPWLLIFLFIWGIFVGWMNESISIGVSGGMFVYLILKRKELEKSKVALILGYLLGTALIVFSPGTFTRAANGEINMEYSFIQVFTMRLIVIIQMLIKFPVNIIGLFVVIFQLYKKNYSLLGCIYLFTLLFLYLLGMDSDRVFYGMSIVSLLLCMEYMQKYLKKYSNHNTLLNFSSFVLFIICVSPCIKAVGQVKEYHNINKAIEADILAASSKCVIEERQLPPLNKFVYATKVSPDSHTVHNRARGYYYNKSSVQSLPSFLFNQYVKKSFTADLQCIPINVSDNLQLKAYISDSHPYLILPMPAEYVIHNYIQCQVHRKIENETLKSYQIIIRWLLGNNNKTSLLANCYYIEHDGNYYYILPYNSHISSFIIPIKKGNVKHDLHVYLRNANS